MEEPNSSEEVESAYSAPISYADNTDDELLRSWDTVRDMDDRDRIYAELFRRKLFPWGAMDTWEKEAGLYPGTDDPRFIEKLMAKQEFAENLQESFAEQQANKVNPCDTQEEFELSPVQRFISRFMSPQCPYLSALLFHGVGVGKTCAAIATAEAYLRSYPDMQVFIVAPRTIQDGFRRTIYDKDAVVISTDESVPNTLRGCTGSEYLKRTGSEYEQNRDAISRRVAQAINSRYKIMGYIQFYNYIREVLNRVPKGLDKTRRAQEETRVLTNEFSGRLLIIDEAHNLRDAPGETDEDNLDAAGGDAEVSEAKAGKRLTPALLQVLRAAEDMKLMLLTGTPMYNSYREIVFLLNLLLINDKKATLSERDIFTPVGTFVKGGEEKLGNVATAYMSYMRGENPLSFPVRLEPKNVARVTAWPTEDPQGQPVDVTRINKNNRFFGLPFVPVSFKGEDLRNVRAMAEDSMARGGLGIQNLDQMVQTGNWFFPGTDLETRIRDIGFDNTFEEVKGTGLAQFKATEDPTWLSKAGLEAASPKAAFILNRMANPSAKTYSRGVIFIYSRFIKSGALPLAIALEANGYTAWNRDKPLFQNGPVDGLGRQCAKCEGRERGHTGKSHPFTPARYILLTGSAAYSPNNAAAIQAARKKSNADGSEIKVIIGSQVASEGIDLRFVREIYVFDSWFHMNKMEQVLGRGVRTCSHSLLPDAQKNCTIHLLVNTYGEEPVETADLYMYRKAMEKAIQIGAITRVLKRYALDCNLNLPAILATSMNPLEIQEDSQGEPRKNVPLNDTPFSSICDWLECTYTCAKPLTVNPDRAKMDTYDEYAMRWRELQLKAVLKNLFENGDQPMIQIDSIIETMRAQTGAPEIAVRTLLAGLVGKKSFRLAVNGQEGYIEYRNTFYVFQPIRLADVRIPLALRVADVPIRKDFYEPTKISIVPTAVAAPAAAAAPAAEAAPAVGAPTAAAVPAAKEAAALPTEDTAAKYWAAIVSWADTIAAGTSDIDIPPTVTDIIQTRYSGGLYQREFNILIMISWMYEDIQRNPAYAEDKRAIYRKVLATALCEMVWDESLTFSEQYALLKAATVPEGNERLFSAAKEQRVKRGTAEAFRYVIPTTGALEYLCGAAKCNPAQRSLFDKSTADPLYNLQANQDTAGRIYGMILPKLKDGKLIFKTNDRPVAPGVQPNKGGECTIVTSIDSHKKELVQIRGMIGEIGYPPFLTRDEILNEKESRKKKTEEITKGAKKPSEFMKIQSKLQLDSRKFQNVVKACALKDIVLRMIDIMEQEKPGAKRYFYRPIAAIKTNHKLK